MQRRSSPPHAKPVLRPRGAAWIRRAGLTPRGGPRPRFGFTPAHPGKRPAACRPTGAINRDGLGTVSRRGQKFQGASIRAWTMRSMPAGSRTAAGRNTTVPAPWTSARRFGENCMAAHLASRAASVDLEQSLRVAKRRLIGFGDRWDTTGNRRPSGWRARTAATPEVAAACPWRCPVRPE